MCAKRESFEQKGRLKGEKKKQSPSKLQRERGLEEKINCPHIAKDK
jgi:hypothetical protein